MTGVLVVAHAPLASAFVACAKHVYGTLSDVCFCDIDSDLDSHLSSRYIMDQLLSIQSPDVLVLVDTWGATPANIAHQALQQQDIKRCSFVTGLNLPMLLRSLAYQQSNLTDLTDLAVQGGVRAISHMSEDA